MKTIKSTHGCFLFFPFIIFLLLGQNQALATCEQKLLELAKNNLEKKKIYCQFETLKKMGMNEVGLEGKDIYPVPEVKDWNPCQIKLEEKANSITCDEKDLEGFQKRVTGLFDHNLLTCLIKPELSESIESAAEKFKENKKYGFPKEGCKSTLSNYATLPIEKWETDVTGIIKEHKKETKYYSYFPKDQCSPSEAIECFNKDKCITECALGQQVAMYSMMKEYLGETAFNIMFKGKIELVYLGNLDNVEDSKNPWWGKDGRNQAQYESKDLKQMPGPRYLVGLSGGLNGASHAEAYLKYYQKKKGKNKKPYAWDTNLNQNFVFTSISDDAYNEWKEEDINEKTHRLWFMERILEGSKKAKKGGLEMNIEEFEMDAMKLALKHPSLEKANLKSEEKKGKKSSEVMLSITPEQVEIVRKAAEQLRASPSFTEVKLFVHPTGSVTLLEHLDAVKPTNDVPFQFLFYPDNINNGIFKMIKDNLMEECQNGLTTKK